VRYCWSFGNAGQNYLYSKEVEPWKRAVHYARVLGDCSVLESFGIDSDGSRADIRAHHEDYKKKYIAWYVKNVMLDESDYKKLLDDLTGNIRRESDKLRALFDIPENEAVMAVIALGYRAQDPNTPQHRPLDEVVKFY
jgi:hypothetical protein